MPYNKHDIQTSDPYKKVTQQSNNIKNIYYGEVVDNNDPTDGGRIRVKILGLDNKITDNNELPHCYPMLPKFLHVYPQVGEMVRIYIEDIRYPQRGRFWMGSIISQPQKMGYDSIYTALSTTNMGLTNPEKAPSTFPDAEGVFPKKTDIGIIGRNNTDIILSEGQVELRAGKHENDDILKLNTRNPASVSLNYERKEDSEDFYSNTIISSDKIAIISHNGNPQFKAARLTPDDRRRIYNQGHPIARGDLIVSILEIFRKALIGHIHPYSAVPVDKNSVIEELEKIDFDSILQRNIVIN